MKQKIHSNSNTGGHLAWWQLSLLGVGCTTGTGFFLGTSIGIRESGYSIIVTLFLAAIATYLVFDSLARLIAQESLDGSYRAYAKKGFGHWAGFMIGWIYWSSEMMILGSTLTALGLFSQFWFPNAPLWMLASIFAVLGILIVLAGGKSFEKAENVFAVIKIAAIFMFIVLSILTWTGVIDIQKPVLHYPTENSRFFTHGARGLWAGFIFSFYAFAGIEVVGLMATNLKDPKEAPKSGKTMIFILSGLYFLSIILALLLVPLNEFSTDESPFLTALKHYDFPILVHLFNGALIIAGFSTVAASLYCVTMMVVNLAAEGDAPKLFRRKKDAPTEKLPLTAMGLTLVGVSCSICAAVFLPKNMYEYITTAGSLMLMYTWLFILATAWKLLKPKVSQKFKMLLAGLFILIAAAGCLLEKTSRTGFFFSLLVLILVSASAFILHKWKWQKAES
ncbi:GerAB/ArcD/ProY family transporter [Falsibacillus pallidus]|uniref:GerAB/ArcD/ProY family transporter n=1 Tax=Falsibacillus pallidus TaxID=493781 RepID=UPI003D95E376